MTNIAQIKSIETKLLNLAKEAGRGAMEQRTLFLLERALARLVLDPELHKGLVFKGGFVAMKVYGSQRFTTDMDTALNGISTERAKLKIAEAMAADLSDGAWFEFEKQEKTLGQGEYEGLRLGFRAGLGEIPPKINKALFLGIDIGVGDPVTPQALAMETAQILGEGRISWMVYPIETMIAEKLHALLYLGRINSRSKDIYDMNIFWSQADISQLKIAIERPFVYRNFQLPKSFYLAASSIDTTVLKRGWNSATATLPQKFPFDDVYEP